jgi:uncharacterized protein YjiS (DUF1127 family)
MQDDSATMAATGALRAPQGTGHWREAAHAAWRAFVAWRATRRRERRDLSDLAHMTERELRDIGVSLGDIPAAADPHWSRDWPR